MTLLNLGQSRGHAAAFWASLAGLALLLAAMAAHAEPMPPVSSTDSTVEVAP